MPCEGGVDLRYDELLPLFTELLSLPPDLMFLSFCLLKELSVPEEDNVLLSEVAACELEVPPVLSVLS